MAELKSSTRAFERAARELSTQRVSLRLYVAGNAASSLRAVANIKRMCGDHLADRYDLDVVDVFQQPERAREDQVLALPTLIRYAPPPASRLIGDLTDEARVLVFLGVSRGPSAHGEGP